MCKSCREGGYGSAAPGTMRDTCVWHLKWGVCGSARYLGQKECVPPLLPLGGGGDAEMAL